MEFLASCFFIALCASGVWLYKLRVNGQKQSNIKAMYLREHKILIEIMKLSPADRAKAMEEYKISIQKGGLIKDTVLKIVK